MARTENELDAVVVGAGWAGLAVSGGLKEVGLAHVVLERNRLCETWRTQRWTSFRMNTPNVLTVMPGDAYDGPDPEGYMTRDAFVAMIEEHVARRALPVETNTAVTDVRPNASGSFDVATSRGAMRARNVVIATGDLNVPKRPRLDHDLPSTVTQIDASDYRDAGQLGPGAVLVIGCGNSGGQVAEDIARAGRQVYIATGRNGRVPRSYRGRDIILWLVECGRFDQPRDAAKGRPLLGATHTISLQSLSAQGVHVLGRFAGMTDRGHMLFADDLLEHARFGDQVSADIKAEIDAYIEREGLSVPAAEDEEAETVAPRFPDPPIRSLDLAARGIGTIVWCVGFRGDFSWLHVPGALDDRGEPCQERSISVPGIYFTGLDTSEAMKSGTIIAAEDESRRIVRHILSHRSTGAR